MKQIRYTNRNNVDELIQPLLNLDILNFYATEEGVDIDQNMFPRLPMIFDSEISYFNDWHLLFLYETYNQLINKKNDTLMLSS